MTKSTFKIVFTVAVLGSIFGRALAWGLSPIVGSAPIQPALTQAEARGDFSGDDAGSVTAAKLQVCANALPTSNGVTNANSNPVGGTIHLPIGNIDLGATPLRLSNGVVLSGSGRGATYIRYSGPGNAIRFVSAGYQMSSGVEHLSIQSSDGGIGYENCTSDVSGARLIDLSISAAGYAIDLTANNPAQRAYAEFLQDIKVTGGSVRVGGVLTTIDHLSIVNAPANGKPALDISGQGELRTLWLEGDSGDQPLLRVKGSWTSAAWWIEPHFAKPHAQVILDAGTLTADDTTFVLSTQPWQLINSSTLNCSLQPDAEDAGGGHPTGTARATLLSAIYQCDASSTVLSGGAPVAIVKQPQTAKLQSPTTVEAK